MVAHTRKTLLLAAVETIRDPARWTTGAYARNPDDEWVFVDDVTACKFCAMGALLYEVLGTSSEELRPLLHEDEIGEIITLNDRDGREAVIAHMLAMAEREPA